MSEKRLIVVFRVDASINIGIGHVMRCLTLADELNQQGHECWFVCREHTGHLGNVITSKGYSLTLLPAQKGTPPKQKSRLSDDYAFWLGVSWQEDANQTLDAISPLSPDWLVVDHYALDIQWERTLSSAVGKIMVIDDLANRPHECALLLDQNFGRAASDYDDLLPAESQRLIGLHYALLRPEFSELREKSLLRRQKPELNRILISLGGVDRTNVTGQILKMISSSSLPTSTELDIIMGATAPHLDEIRALVDLLPFKATVSVDVKDMAHRMCLADLAIGAGGSTSWERCCLGLPAIIFVLAENQKHSAELLNKHKAIIIVTKTEQIKAKIEHFLKKANLVSEFSSMTYAAQKLVDGAGCERVTKIIASKTRERR